MYNDYNCPNCNGHLRLGHTIILSAIRSNNQGSIILLHPEPGNYSADYHPETRFEKGDLVTFFCPICHHDLSSNKHKNLAMVKMIDNGKVYDIYFSRIAGEHSTLKMLGEHVEWYGKNSEQYLDFFNMSQMY
jgi:uncharacterized protein YbaR (Trm112 family)